ncbi:MAG: THUMP domain-containing protein [Tannerella sp.]|nr:THUMP domain-containing protein [Tannerella sp.]
MVAKTLYGLEDVLAEELVSLGAENVEAGKRMVSFTGDKRMLYRANFCCRTALRILKPVCYFEANNADTVYREVKNMEWDRYLSLEKTFTVDSVVYSEDFNHSKFVAYRVKDAIADYFNDKYGKRPSVRVNNPDLYVNIHISRNDCTVSLDSSGESLHKRGYRVSQVDAPLNEVLAAGMILKTGWRGEANFVDPMCGSGTLLIEAAMIALNMAPGVCRKEYAFERWPDFDRELFEEIYNDESAERAFKFKCYGSDISPLAIEKAMKNIRSAGLSKYIELKTAPFQQYSEAPKPGILVMNPPYGERISTNDIFDLYTMIGERLKHVFTGYNAWMLSYKEECFDAIGLRPKHRFKLMNGDLECEYRCYELFEGKNKEYKRSLKNGENQPASPWAGNGTRRDDGRAGRQGKTDDRPGRYDESRSSENRKFAEERIASKRTESFDRGKKLVQKVRNPYERDDDKPFKKFGKEQRKPYDRNRKS